VKIPLFHILSNTGGVAMDFRLSVQWYLIVDLIGFSLMTHDVDVKRLPYAYLTSVYFLWQSVW
jgi:hypothetical protein